MIIAKLYNILEHLISSGVPLHTEMKIGLYVQEGSEARLNILDLNGLVADAQSGVVYLACGDREAPFELHHVDEKQHEWETFVLKVDGSEAIKKSQMKTIGMDGEVLVDVGGIK
jgi:hypothetical protein